MHSLNGGGPAGRRSRGRVVDASTIGSRDNIVAAVRRFVAVLTDRPPVVGFTTLSSGSWWPGRDAPRQYTHRLRRGRHAPLAVAYIRAVWVDVAFPSVSGGAFHACDSHGPRRRTTHCSGPHAK